MFKKNIIKVYNSPTFNTWSSLATRSLNIVVLIPFILKEFSPAEVTLWYLFGTIASFNFLFELGFGPSFVRAISYGMGGASSMKDRKGNGVPNEGFLKHVWQNTKVVYLLLSLLFFIILIFGGYFVVNKPISFLSNKESGWITWTVTILGTAFSFWGNMFTVFLQGANKIAVFRRYETIFSLCSITSCAIGINLGLDFVGLVILIHFWNVLSVIRNYLLCTKEEIYKKIKSKFTFNIDREIIKDLWHTSWRSAIGMIMSFGIINSSALYFAQLDDVKEVSSYLFCFRILQIIISFSMAPFYTKIPELARLYITNDNKNLIKNAKKGMMLSHYSFVFATIFVGVLAPYALKYIDSSIQFIDSKLWALLILAYFIERYGAMHMQLYSITNNIVWHIANSITGIILLIFLLITLPSLVFYAFPISMIASYLGFYTWYAAKKSLKLLNLNFFQFERNIFFVPAIIILVYVSFIMIHDYYV